MFSNTESFPHYQQLKMKSPVGCTIEIVSKSPQMSDYPGANFRNWFNFNSAALFTLFHPYLSHLPRREPYPQRLFSVR